MKRISFVLLIGMALLLAACFPRPAVNTTLVLLSTPTPRPVDNRTHIAGQVVLAEPADLSFAISGKIIALDVQEGDTVSAGDEIARLDPASLQMDVTLAEAALKVAQADLDKAKMPAHPAQVREMEMKATAAAAVQPRSLIEATQMAADSEVALAQLAYLLAQPLPQEVAAAEASVALAAQRLEAAKARLAQTFLPAPVSGVITRVYVSPYEFASTGSQVVQIADLNNVHVEAQVSADKALGLKIGDGALLSLAGAEPSEVEAVIVSMRPDNSTANGQGFVIVLAPKTPTAALHWGTAVEVILP